jgi:hypothetical protein
LGLVVERHDGAVPNVGMEIEAMALRRSLSWPSIRSVSSDGTIESETHREINDGGD